MALSTPRPQTPTDAERVELTEALKTLVHHSIDTDSNFYVHVEHGGKRYTISVVEDGTQA